MPRKRKHKKQKKGPALKRTGRPQAMSEYLSLLENFFPLIFGLTTHVITVSNSKGADQNYWLNKKTEKFAKKIMDATLDYVTTNIERYKKIQEKHLKDSLIHLYECEKKLLGQKDKLNSEEVADLLIKNRLPSSQENIDIVRGCFTSGPGLSKLKAAGYGPGVKEKAMYVASLLMNSRADVRSKYTQLSPENFRDNSVELAEFLILLNPPKAPSHLEVKYRLLSLLGAPEKAIELIKEEDMPGKEAYIKKFLEYHRERK